MDIIETDVVNGRIKALSRDPSGQIIGSAWGGIEGDAAVLDTVQVDPPKRGKGVGRQVVNGFVAAARQAGAKTIKGEVKPEFGLRVKETKQFYDKLGFRVGEDGTLEMDL